jgi:hypothetical protein
VLTETKREKAGSGKKPKETDLAKLEIKLSNRSANDYPAVTAQYYIFVRDIASREILVGKVGSASVSLPAVRSATVISDPVTLSKTPARTKKVEGKTEKVPASGKEYAGYGVRVQAGNAIIGEQFSSPELKSKTGNLPPSGSDKPKKPKKKPE